MEGKWRPNIVSSSATDRTLMAAFLHFYTNSSPVKSQFSGSTPTSCDLSPQNHNSMRVTEAMKMNGEWMRPADRCSAHRNRSSSKGTATAYDRRLMWTTNYAKTPNLKGAIPLCTAQAMIDTFVKLKKESLKYGLTVNVHKIKYLKYSRRQEQLKAINVENKEIEQVR